MKIFPAIDLYNGKAVRLYKGDYQQMTIYNDNPLEVALDFKNKGATNMHIVDLEGAKNGTTPNLNLISQLASIPDMEIEVGGGIRSLEVVKKYIDAGVDRVILGTSAVTNQEFLTQAIKKYGDKIAVGVDIKDGFVAIKGWTEKSNLNGIDFCVDMQNIGVKTIICTDISKDGAMKGANHNLYKELKEKLNLNIIASGGVSSIEDVTNLAKLDIYGAIVGKAYYTGAIDLTNAIKVAK